MQDYDKSGQGISVGHINNIRVLGYADDATMCEEAVEAMTQRITEFADAALAEADMRMKLSKTYTQHLQRQEKVAAATTEEADREEDGQVQTRVWVRKSGLQGAF